VTFSIVARDLRSGALGVAVASKALCVGAHVPWGEGGVGAIATQAWHDLRYGYEGLALLQRGMSPAAVAASLTLGDPEAPFRQVGIVDSAGHSVSYTGSRCMPWAGSMSGAGYAVQGNLLVGPGVVEAMARTYDGLEAGRFADRLLAALAAGDAAGGDRRGRQSAALRLWRGAPSSLPVALLDLRVDDGTDPVTALGGVLRRARASDSDELELHELRRWPDDGV